MHKIKSWIAGHGAIHALCLAACVIIPVGFVAYALLKGEGGGNLLSGSLLLPLLLCGAMHIVMMRMMGHSHGHGDGPEERRADGGLRPCCEKPDASSARNRGPSLHDRLHRPAPSAALPPAAPIANAETDATALAPSRTDPVAR